MGNIYDYICNISKKIGCILKFNNLLILSFTYSFEGRYIMRNFIKLSFLSLCESTKGDIEKPDGTKIIWDVAGNETVILPDGTETITRPNEE